MRRFCLLALLTLLSSSAHAGSFSFSVGGRRIHIEFLALLPIVILHLDLDLRHLTIAPHAR